VAYAAQVGHGPIQLTLGDQEFQQRLDIEKASANWHDGLSWPLGSFPAILLKYIYRRELCTKIIG